MESFAEENTTPDPDMRSEADLTQDFDAQLKLTDDDAQEDGSTDVKQEDDHGSDEEEEEEEDEDEYDDEEEEEFSFMCGEANTSPIAAEDAFANGQIKTVFPLFSGEYLHENLPMRPPVRKIFVETEHGGVTSADATEGPSCEWSSEGKAVVEATPEVCKKSNSTGFSKIWRFKDLLGRSNSDGRDAFVFLNDGGASASSAARENKDSTPAVAREATVRRKMKKGAVKTAPLSAHEVYLKRRAKGEERRRSYLPYRPELMGFFTNVSGGLSKNVHPY